MIWNLVSISLLFLQLLEALIHIVDQGIEVLMGFGTNLRWCFHLELSCGKALVILSGLGKRSFYSVGSGKDVLVLFEEKGHQAVFKCLDFSSVLTVVASFLDLFLHDFLIGKLS